jgi:phosphoglycerol transferase MdoB-like AlkP superfamily enzyme
MTLSRLLHLMQGGLRFDLTAALYTNIVFIVGNLLPFRFRQNAAYRKTMKWIFYITNSLSVAVNCIDIAYFRFTMKRMTWSVLQEFSNDKGNFALIWQFLVDFWYLLLIFIVLIWLMVFLYNRLPDKLQTRPILGSWLYYPVCTVIMAVGMALFVGGVRGGFAHSTRPITISNAAAYVEKPVEIGIVLSTPFSIYRTLSHQKYKKYSYFDAAALDSVYTPVHKPDMKSDSAFVPKNVVIIIVESLSKEYIGAFNRDLDGGNYRGYTPFLDSLITRSYTFAHSFGNGLKSIDAMPSALASIPSFPEPYVLSVYSNNTIRGLAATLAEKGYDCSFFHGAPNGSMGFDAFARMSGFQHYYGKNEYGNDDDFDGMWAIWDEPFLQFVAGALNEKTEPFLGAVFTATSHHPFNVPAQYEGKFPKGTEQIHQCVGYTDWALRRFFETASKMSWFANTLFVITADHTNQVSYPKSKTSIGSFVIPIIYYDPSGKLPVMTEPLRVTQQIDIMPTVLSYLNYGEPYFAFGFAATGGEPDEYSSGHFAINYNGFYNVYSDSLVLQIRDEQPFALFNYNNDILLENNLLHQLPDEAGQLHVKYKAFRQQYNQHLIDNDMTVK